jgi:predicted ATPase/signal transduction histidine kinase/tRNA A-37 threonylcarbamoyl transferase component Bud32
MIHLEGYDVGRELHRSARTLVYLGTRRDDARQVILKSHTRAIPTEQEKHRLRRELEISKLFHDARIRRYSDLCEQGQRLFLVADYFGGTSLRAAIPPDGFPVREFLRVALSLVECLQTIHERGIIHKDFNSSNCLLQRDSGHVEVIDFGLSSRASLKGQQLVNLNTLEGTLPYISPEQTGRINRAVDHRTDFYSLGVTYYEMLTGELPFSADDAFAYVHAHIAKAPPAAHERNRAVPPALSLIVQKLMAKSAEDRYQSALGIHADLAYCLEQLERQGRVESFPLGREDFSGDFHLVEKLYGREREAAVLQHAFERASHGDSGMVVVAGYSGVGKSSLVSELHKPVTEAGGLFLGGKFEQYRRNLPYDAFVQAFRGVVDMVLGESEADLRRWGAILGDALGANAGILTELIPALELILGKQPEVPKMGPAESQNRFNQVIRRFVAALARERRPLVLFLDDLQWADTASLGLLKALMTSSERTDLLVVGAYRDNVVDAAHPLMLCLSGMEDAGAHVARIAVQNLGLDDVYALLSDAGLAPEQVGDLAESIHAKTRGNAFFVHQFLESILAQGLLRPDLERRLWVAEVGAIEQLDITENVADFMSGRLRELSPRIQELLAHAACIGAVFGVELLTASCGLPEMRVRQWVDDALAAGLILPYGESYKFAHDRIQRAAYSLLDDAQRRAVHHRLGTLLRAALEEGGGAESSIFDVVRHLNEAMGVAPGGGDVRPRGDPELAVLNARAGERAKQALAYDSAHGYFALALRLLGETPWVTAHDVAFECHREAAECASLTARYDDAAALLAEGLAHARDAFDKGELHIISMTQKAIQGQYQGAVREGIAALRLLDVHVPELGDDDALAAAFERAQAQFGRAWQARPIRDLGDLPRCSDREAEMVMNLLATSLDCLLIGAPAHLKLFPITMVNYSIEHGNTRVAPIGYIWHALVLAEGRQFAQAYEFGDLALRLNEDKLHNEQLTCRLLNMFGGFIMHLERPFHERDAVFLRGAEAGLDSGDFLYAGYNLTNRVRGRLFAGMRLADFLHSSREDVHQIEKIASPMYDLVQVFRGFALYLSDQTVDQEWPFDHDSFCERAYRERYAEVTVLTAHLDYYRLAAAALMGQWEDAAARAEALDATGLVSQVESLEFRFYAALAWLHLLPRAAPERLADRRAELDDYLDAVARAAESSPENFGAAHAVLSAELARIEGRDEDARDGYDDAILAAKKGGLLHEQALVHELASAFWSVRGKTHVASLYAREARALYADWGAVAKVEALDAVLGTRRPGRTESTSVSTYTGTGESSFDALDLHTVVKASRAISEEIELSRLLTRMMETILENAGARRGAIILERAGALQLGVHMAVAPAPEALAPGTPLTELAAHLPVMLIQYVARAGEDVVCSRGEVPSFLERDAYLAAQRPQSILCTPVYREGMTRGVLYLENELAANAFRDRHVRLMRVLLAQAAISLENAYVHENLEKLVQQRTEELEVAHRRLVEEAHRAGMADIARDTLHNIGNILNSLSVALFSAQDTLHRSAFRTYQRMNVMLREHISSAKDLAFSDPEAQKLLEGYLKLEDILAHEREHILQALAVCSRQTEAITTVVMAQQRYVTATPLTEREHLETIINDALTMQAQSLETSGIAVTKRIDPVGRVPVQKTKLLHILHCLLDNAKDAIAAKANGPKDIWIAVGRREERVYLSVRDSGVGIPPDVLRKIFQRGYTTKEHHEGLSLHYCANYMAEMGGRIWAESEGAGRGCTFFLTLPA